LGFVVEYNLSGLSFQCLLDRPIESVTPKLQQLFPHERKDFTTLKSKYDDFIQIFFVGDGIITHTSSRCRMTLKPLSVPPIMDAEDIRFTSEEKPIPLYGSPDQKMIEIVLDDTQSKIAFFRHAANVAAGMHEGMVERLSFFDAAFVGDNRGKRWNLARCALVCPLPELAARVYNSPMLFCTQSSGTLAISQPSHAWISGQLLRAWDETLGESLLLAAEQHDIGWMDWETAPSFDPQTGRPHLFRAIGAAVHAPMWTRGVELALGAWGTHVALLISRHGGVIYRRYTDRHRIAAADAAAAEKFLNRQAPIEAEWTRKLGLEASVLEKETRLLALVDTLSLGVCGELRTPIDLVAPGRHGDILTMRLTERPGQPLDFIVDPWPFRMDVVTVEGEARALPPDGRFSNEAAMRAWLAAPERVLFQARLMPVAHR
jgi:Protein of unknown function (DUF3891)